MTRIFSNFFFFFRFFEIKMIKNKKKYIDGENIMNYVSN